MTKENTAKELELLKEQSNPLVKQAELMEITTEDHVDAASIFLSEIQSSLKMIESKRKEITGPINQSLKVTNAMFKEISEPLKEAKNELSGKILLWKKNEERMRDLERRERQRKIDEATKIAKDTGLTVIEEPEPKILIKNKIGNIQGRKTWTYRVVDADKVPNMYKIIHDVFVKAKIKQGVRNIPGIEIYQEESLSIVGRS